MIGMRSSSLSCFTHIALEGSHCCPICGADYSFSIKNAMDTNDPYNVTFKCSACKCSYDEPVPHQRFRRKPKMKVEFFYAWYDLWIGVYVDVEKKCVYICPLPCMVFRVSWSRKSRDPDNDCARFVNEPRLYGSPVYRDCQGDGHHKCQECLRHHQWS